MEFERDHHVALVFNEAFGFFDHHLCDLHVAGGGLVEGRRNDFAFHRALHVGDFFRTLVDQQHHQNNFRMIRGDGVGDVLQQHGFAGARRGHDEAALSLAKGREQVHDAGAGILAGGLEFEALLRIERRQVVEEDLIAGFIRRFEVDGFILTSAKYFSPREEDAPGR